MPKINKQTTQPQKTTKPQIQTSRSNEEEFGGFKLNVYGRGKTGKTRMACSFPKPMLLIGTEDGTKSVCTSKKLKDTLACEAPLYELLTLGKPTGVDFVRLQSSEWMEEITEFARSSYRSVCIDHGGGLQDLVFKEVLNLDEIPLSKSWGMADRSVWGVVNTQVKERLNKLLALADSDNLNVIVIAHERNFNEEGNSDVIVPSVGSALSPGSALWLDGACDYICQTFIRAKEEFQTTTIGDKQIQTKVASNKVEYCLRIGPHPVYRTGFRIPEGIEMPDSIVNPSYDKIVKVIQGISLKPLLSPLATPPKK